MKLNVEYSSENIVENIGKVLNVNVIEKDILVVYFLFLYKKDVLLKIIVKFICRNVCNEFYVKRKVFVGKNFLEDFVFKSFFVGKNIYIFELLIF